MENKVAFYTLGCKLNFAETSTISHYFENEGYNIVAFNDFANIYVINTCSVTANANKKSRNAISRAKSKNPDAIIIATGCYAQLKPEDLIAVKGVDYIVGANDKDKIAEIIKNIEKKENSLLISTDHKDMTRFFPSVSYGERTRSFFKIQDGCDYFCAYCTIPYARGRSRNESIANSIIRAKDIAAKGIKEIILTGVNIGDFGKSTKESFYELLLALTNVEGLERIRLSSIEPNLLTDEIIEFVAQNKKLMPHFHIPLQSGSDVMLKMIRRKYDTNLFRNKIEKIRTVLPNAFIGIDLIVGLNGETDALFEDTVTFVKSLNVSFIHHFQYSEREGTPAVSFTPKTSSQTKHKRAEIITNISNLKHKQFQEKQIGTKHVVLFESSIKDNTIFGFTDNYIKVATKYDKQLINSIKKVEITGFIDTDVMSIKII
ncbi:MAG: tRNA (N(6)-L-threonylcarbamoyladenosine(37)-C(2))-methylthiotransferase MtaB [Bacteroidales bacterium]|nr:tRNA (N(6)-L-threonylcarbamoyladenosine(37)-C(2))-methylthiotransferase MtaB [Bacteroidales bacterium]MDD4215955.1 tRNA (N(6)-L-threonylcarbamoyladenosine(37)-C(2))-methylthiotransferase MtaB [Bacteroidales bacterium]MDY0141029.1 tRNA (N(6)-L-threonylcarbamoyladenosine(37)-C(2))-methylthiotransferase MtaB [Bacteroidales bacterium]